MTPSLFRKTFGKQLGKNLLATACLGFVLLASSAAWSQSDTDSLESKAADSTDETPLQLPPPVSGQAYSSVFAGDTESNFLRAGFTFTGTYSNNVAGGSNPVSDFSYSFWPSLAIDKLTERMHLILNYSPGFTVYQKTTALNQINQNVGANLQYRLSPYLTLNLHQAFQQSSNVFDQPNPLGATPVSGAAPVQGVGVIAPVAEQLSDSTNAQLTYQIGEDGMLGAGGTFASSYYPNPGESSGLYNSRTAGGSIFYSRRLHEKYYLGASYQYQNLLSYLAASPGTHTQTQTIFFFFTANLKPGLSLSVSGGPQHYTADQAPLPPAGSWSPTTTASLSWQGERTTFATSYTRIVSGAGGLNGAFHSDAASVSGLWQIARTWKAGVSGGYSTNKTVTPLFILSSPGGHTLSGTASMQHQINDHFNLQFGYSWAHQSYGDIPALSATPNINRVFFSLNYQFNKPLER
jgi:hypothetical protein